VGATCSICGHVERDGIDRDIVAGVSQRTIARQWCVSRDAVQRHAKHHISAALAAMQVERERTEKTTALARVEDAIGRVERVLDAAETEGKSGAMLSAVAQLRPLIELLAKLTGELREQPVVTVNLLSSPEILSALNVVYGELRDLPEIRQRIAARLQPERLQIEGPQ